MEQSWFVKDDNQSVYGPVTHEVLNDWRRRGLIAESYYVSNDQTNWILASQYFAQTDDDYTYIERIKDLYEVFLKGSKWLVSNYLSGLQIKGEFTNPHARRFLDKMNLAYATEAFCNEVDKVLPDYLDRKQWLRVNRAGMSL